MARFVKLDERVQQWFLRVARKRTTPSLLGEAGLKKSFPQGHQEPGKFPYTVLLLEESPNTEAVTVPPMDELDTYPSFPTVEKVEKQPLLTVGPSREESPNTEAVAVPPLHELDTYPSFPTVEKVEEQPLLTVGSSRKEIAGSGQFERGQCDIAVAHPHVTPSSVVVVLLTGNPGPVVVQYVSLDPGRGFTVHLSAPVERTTPFNYAIL
jgi:hypothetical protein